MATKKELIADLKKLGITETEGFKNADVEVKAITGDEKVADLESMLAIMQNVKKDEAEGQRDSKPPVQASEKNKTKGSFFVWLKSKAYISDNERLEAGFYQMEGVPERLSKLPSNVVEVFENEVPSRKLAQIARWAGINPDGIHDDEEILSKILTEVKPIESIETPSTKKK